MTDIGNSYSILLNSIAVSRFRARRSAHARALRNVCPCERHNINATA